MINIQEKKGNGKDANTEKNSIKGQNGIIDF